MRTRLIYDGKVNRHRITPIKTNAGHSVWRPPTIESLEDRTSPATLQHSLLPPNIVGPQQDAKFGNSVSVDSAYIVVGAAESSAAGFIKVGQAFVYSAVNRGLVATLNNPNPTDYDTFGRAVAVSGNYVVVSANNDDYGATNAGIAYVFSASTGALMSTLYNPNPVSFASFGGDVAISGSNVVVSDYNYDYNGVVGRVCVFDATSGALIRSINNPTPSASNGFGNSVAMAGDTLVVGAPNEDAGATDSGAVYLFSVATGALVGTLNNPTPANIEYFGEAVAISGNKVIVGESGENMGIAVGIAYVFDSVTATLVATLNNPTPVSGDRFGNSVGISGNIAVIGAHLDDSGASNAGSAYVFDATTGTLVASVNNPAPASSDDFGNAVAVSGNNLVVGAYHDNAGATDAGSVYVFSSTNGALVGSLANPTAASNDQFGYSVAVSGSRVVVGAYLDDTGATDSGAAYVFDTLSGALIATLNNPNPATGDQFGYSVAIEGNTIVVAAVLDNAGATDSGTAYLFNATTGGLISTLNNPTSAASDRFGVAVAVGGGIVVVGANQDDTGATDAGSAYLFSATSGALLGALNNPSPANSDQFGYAVAIASDTVVVGALTDDAAATDAGSAYVFRASTRLLVATLDNPTPAINDQFGGAVAVASGTIVVGAALDDTGFVDCGTAYLFDPTTGALLATLNNPTPSDGDQFGSSVAASGNAVMVGALSDNATAGDAGSAYFFDAATGGTLNATLQGPSPRSGDHYGNAVAIYSTTAVVGAREVDTQNADQGSAFVYLLDPVTVTMLGPITPDPRNSAVSSAQVVLTGSVNLSTFTAADFTLTRNGGPNLLTGAQTVSLVSGTTYQISGLAGLTGVDGTYVLTVNLSGVNDSTGQAGAGSASDTWIMDTAAPQITGVYFDSTAWSAGFRAAAGMTANGCPAENGATQFASLPWNNVNVIRVRFSEPVAVAAATLGVRGLNTADYFATSPTFTYDSVNFIASWTLTNNIDTDRIILDLDGDSGSAVMDLAGNKLAGSWTEGVSSFPTTGAAGNDFKYRFVVAVGDASRNGQVRNADVNLVRANLFVDAGQAGYNIYGDIDGNGLTRNADVNVVRSHLFIDPPSGPGPNRPAKGFRNHSRNDDVPWGCRNRLVSTRVAIEISESLVRRLTTFRLRMDAIDALFMEM